MSYREFRLPQAERMDDAHWREMVSGGTAPPPPAFTESFRREAAKK